MIHFAVILGASIQFLGGAAYIWETFKGRVKPNRISYLLWATAPLIATGAAITDGVAWAILPTFIAGFLPLLVLAASFVNKDAYWKLTKFDYLCGVFSVLALILWLVTQDIYVATIFAMLADGLAAIPTLTKAWHYPETESGWPYATTVIGAFLGFFAVKSWDFAEYAFSVYLIFICSLIVFVIYRRKLSFFRDKISN